MSSLIFKLSAFFFLLISSQLCSAQLDSLELLLAEAKEDSTRLKLTTQIGWIVLKDDPQKGLEYANDADIIARKVQDPYLAEDVYRLKAFCYGDMNNRPKCLESHLVRIEILEATNEQTAALSQAYFEVAAVFGSQGQYETAEKYYEKCKELAVELELKQHYGMSLVNLAGLKSDRDDQEGAKADLKLAYKILRKDYAYNAAYAGSQLVKIYIEQDSLEEAEVVLDTSLNIMSSMPENEISGFLFQAKGQVASERNDYRNAIKHFNAARLNWEPLNKYFYLQSLYLNMAYAFAEIGSDSAVYFFKKHNEIRDQAINENNNAQIAEMEAKYENAQNEKEIVLLSKENELSELEAKRQTQISSIAFIGMGVVLLLMIYLISRVRLIRKQKSLIESRNQEITQQKEIVEEKSKELTDSILYAKRIQTAILPSSKVMNACLPENFIFYQPKDIVAGDFYWVHQIKDVTLVAAADCTGHGVPGAMVSVICNNGLNRSVREHGLTKPSDILDKTRQIVIEEFEKSETDVKDGMDIALCSIHQDPEAPEGSGTSLQYAGAHNPLWIIRKGAVEIEEIKADKQPIGQFDNPQPYSTHEVMLEEGDTFYIFSDGYADQFGGVKGKKFKAANLKKLILSIQGTPMKQQESLLEQAFDEWKGSLEQLDDVCVIGVRI